MKQAQKKAVAFWKKKTAAQPVVTLSSNDKQMWKLENQNVQLQTAAAKDKSKANKKAAKEHKKDNTKKELLHIQKDLAKEKDASSTLEQCLDKLEMEKTELVDAKNIWSRS